jgi:hypothetical protein
MTRATLPRRAIVIKRVADVRLGEIEEAARKGDYDLMVRSRRSRVLRRPLDLESHEGHGVMKTRDG